MIGGFVKTAQTRARTLVWRLRRRLGRPMKPGDGLRILFYHRVADDPGDLLAVTRDVFEAEMALLAERGYEVLDVVEALDGPIFPETFCGGFTGNHAACVHTTDCSIRVLWRHLGEALHGVLGTITLADLVTGAPSVQTRRRTVVHAD